GATLSRQRRNPALRCDLSFRQPGRAELLGLENHRQHALDRAHAAAFPRPLAHRRPALQPEINVTTEAQRNCDGKSALALKNRRPGESRDPLFRIPCGGPVGPGFRREDGVMSLCPLCLCGESEPTAWERVMNRLDGKVALISGAARGIGGETARLMVEAGAKVAIGDVLDERGRETARALGDAAIYLHLDVTREEDWNAAVAATVSRFGKLDILVNNAGLFLGKDIEAASLDEWQRLCAVNLTGVFLGTKLALPALREAAQQSPCGSAIVNLASTAGIVGSTQDPLYSMTKGGVTLFTKSAALEFDRKSYRIRVNSIYPGKIDNDKGA